MMRNESEKRKTLVQDLLDTLHTEIVKNTLFVVEGKRDVVSLNKLGVKRIMMLDKPLFAIVEEIAKTEKKMILLVDLDDEGKKLYSKLSVDLGHHGVFVDNTIRDLLFKLPVRHIEGLATFVENEMNKE